MPSDPSKPPPISYENPSRPAPPPIVFPPASRAMVFPFGLARIVWTFSAVLLTVLVYIVPLVQRTFSDYKIELPLVTKVLFVTSQVLRTAYLWLALAAAAAALPFVVGALISQSDTDNTKRMLRVLQLALLLVGVGLTLWVVLGLFLPYVAMIQSLTGGGVKK